MKRESASDRRRDGHLVASPVARDEVSESGADVGFVEHALHELREEHRRLPSLALDPAAREQRTDDVEIPIQICCAETAEVVSSGLKEVT